MSELRWRPFSPGRRIGKGLAAVILVLVVFIVFWQSALAHTEGKMQLSAEAAGPFKLTAFTSPDPATTGELHVAALVFLAEDASPVLEAKVTVKLERLDGAAEPIVVPAALGDAENKLLFEAVADITQPGDYLAVIEIEDDAHGRGSASFDLEVLPEGGFNRLLLIPIGATVIAAAFLLMRCYRNPRSTA